MASWESCKSVLYAIGFCLLLFVGIPIRIEKADDALKTAQYQAKFSNFVSKFNKGYPVDSDDYKTRLTNFEAALKTIDTWNKQRVSNESALYGITEFADLSPEEFSHKFLKHHGHSHRDRNRTRNSHRRHSVTKRAIVPSIPAKVDWRAKGVVTPIKDQGACGACWAFSTVSTVESMLAIKTGQLKELSVQEVIDCARYGNLGCNGGDFCSLLEWLTDNDIALEPATNYPLVLKNDICKIKKGNVGVKVANNFTCDYLIGNEGKILQKLATHGPVIVAVNAASWQYYLGGVIVNNCPGEPEMLNHAVVLVGYDLTAPIPYFIAKNSWGKRFGDGGYVKIATGSNVCGVACEVSSLDVV